MTMIIKLKGGEVRIEPKGYDILSPYQISPRIAKALKDRA